MTDGSAAVRLRPPRPSRRGGRARNLPARSRRSRARRTSPPRSRDTFPSQDPAVVREVVTVAHGRIERLRELVTARPELANAAWDWGFGDWESALGASVAHGTARHRRDPARARRAARRLHRGDAGRPARGPLGDRGVPRPAAQRAARTASRWSRTPAPAARRRGRSCNISSRSATPIRCIPPWSSAPRINAACRECSSSAPNRTIAS